MAAKKGPGLPLLWFLIAISGLLSQEWQGLPLPRIAFDQDCLGLMSPRITIA